MKQPVVRRNKDPSPEASAISEEEPVDDEFEVNEVEQATESKPEPEPVPQVQKVV